jgi:hypothetical protein
MILNPPTSAARYWLALGAIGVLKIHDVLAETTKQTLRDGQIIRQLREFVARGETEKRPENINKLEEASALALVGAKEQCVKTIFRFPCMAASVRSCRS